MGDESQCGTALQGATRHHKRECKLVGEHNPARRFRVWDTPHFETTLRPCIQLRLLEFQRALERCPRRRLVGRARVELPRVLAQAVELAVAHHHDVHQVGLVDRPEALRATLVELHLAADLDHAPQVDVLELLADQADRGVLLGRRGVRRGAERKRSTQRDCDDAA